MPQPDVVVDGRRCRLDEVLGAGFAELALQDGDLLVTRPDGTRIRVADPSGRLAGWLRRASASAVSIRPDRIVRSASP